MSLNVRPIVSALLRNRTGAVLVAMQVAIALAVLVNASYIVVQRVEKIRRPTGIDDAEHPGDPERRLHRPLPRGPLGARRSCLPARLWTA